jgi:hypothetical protein
MSVHNLPELVRDTQLKVTVEETKEHGLVIVHARPLGCRNSSEEQRWRYVKPIGQGGASSVSLQRNIRGPGIELMAVKQMKLTAGTDLTSKNSVSRRYVRELEALAKFAQKKVRLRRL